MSHHHHEPQSVTKYLVVFFALIAGTLITVQVAYIHLGWLNLPMALIIAGIKATLVGWYFMHLNQGSKLNILAAISGLLFLVILIFITIGDYMTRPEVHGWLE